MKSIITNNQSSCFVCGKGGELHNHHVIFGIANRKRADKDGLIVPLCIDCHTGSSRGVHHNRKLDLELKQIGQRAWMKHYNKTEADFIAAYGKNYL